MVQDSRTLEIFVNPLELFELEGELSTDAILKLVCPPGIARQVQDLRQRYSDLESVTPQLFGPPAEARILNQLIWPLRQAKVAFITGNYLSTIALTGLVAEMAALLRFDGFQLERGAQNPLTDEQQKRLFGREFDALGQERRVEVLRVLGAIDDELFQQFSRVRGTRRNHLHLSKEIAPAQVIADARNMYRDAVAIVIGVLGQKTDHGTITMNAWVWRYLKANAFLAEPGEKKNEGTADEAPK